MTRTSLFPWGKGWREQEVGIMWRHIEDILFLIFSRQRMTPDTSLIPSALQAIE